MIAKGLLTRLANHERLSAQTIERDYVLAHVCSEIGTIGDARLTFKGGTLLRLCYFTDYRYSADLDFSAIDGFRAGEAVSLIAAAVDRCRARLELPLLEVRESDQDRAWITYVGPLGAKPRKPLNGA